MTRSEAIAIMVEEWAACRDATGLLRALERIGVVKFDRPYRQELLDRAARWQRPDSLMEVTPENLSSASRLINDLAKELVT